MVVDVNVETGIDNLVYTVKLLKNNGEPDLNEKGNPKYQMVNTNVYNALVERGRAELMFISVVNQGNIIKR